MSNTLALIVDDDAGNRMVLKGLLELEGVDSIQVKNPLDITQSLEDVDHLDVIFLDLEMPEIDGFELLEQMKADPRFSDTPFVAYTVHVSEISVARQMGFHSFLGKPVNAEQFPTYLDRILKNQPVWILPR